MFPLMGFIGGLVVVVSVIPYALRTIQGKIFPNLTSWSLWTLISLAILLSYWSSGATDNVWPAVFDFFNPLIISILVIFQKGGFKKPTKLELVCLVFGVASILIWLNVYDSTEFAVYALVIALVADSCAAIPTLFFVWKNPMSDRPFAWALCSLGYGLSLFAISEHNFANYLLPVYVFLGGINISFPLVFYRIRRKVPLAEWG